MDSSFYDEDYFIRGRETGKSLYTLYSWKPDLTIPMVVNMIHHLGIPFKDTILDFGCARGYVVRAFREMGYNAFGCDTSKWAIENADETIKQYVNIYPQMQEYDWIIAKDVLEHIRYVNDVINTLMGSAKKGVFVVVPLGNGEKYVISDYEKDVTHIHRLPLASWVDWFLRSGWSVEARYRVKGVKDNWSNYPIGNGFITCRRIKE